MILDRARRRAAMAARRRIAGLSVEVREVALAIAGSRRDGPAVMPGPPDGPALVVAPHPDDEVIGPGGAIARHLDAGQRVTVLLVTSGEGTAGGGAAGPRRDVASAREVESRRALAHLGTGVDLRFGRLPDGGLAGCVAEVAAAIGRHAEGCATVYVPTPLDPHPDHRAVAIAAARAGLSAGTVVMGYEVWGAGPVDALLDVTDVFARKQAALAEYAIALETVDYVRAASGLAAYRSASGGMGGRGFAEGFLRHDPASWAALVAPLDG